MGIKFVASFVIHKMEFFPCSGLFEIGAKWPRLVSWSMKSLMGRTSNTRLSVAPGVVWCRAAIDIRMERWKEARLFC